MKVLVFQVALLTVATLIVLAAVFRNRRARHALRFVRNVGWAWVAAIILLAAWRVWQNGGL